MSGFLQQVLNGLLLGGIYALFAVGLTLSLGVLRVMNAAHGATLALSAIVAVKVASSAGVNFPVFLLLAAAVGGAIGVLLEMFAFRPLRFAAGTGTIEMPSLVASLAALFMLQNVGQYWTNSQLINTPLGIFPDRLIFFGQFYVRYVLVVTFVIAVALTVATWFAVNRTQVGRAVRAIAMDDEAVGMLGVNASRLKLLTIAASSAFAGIAGGLLALMSGAVDYNTGSAQLLRGFCVIILGGIGSVPGALVGGLMLGVSEGMTVYFFGSSWQPAAAFVLLILFLLVRPQGVFGKPEVDRA